MNGPARVGHAVRPGGDAALDLADDLAHVQLRHYERFDPLSQFTHLRIRERPNRQQTADAQTLLRAISMAGRATRDVIP